MQRSMCSAYLERSLIDGGIWFNIIKGPEDRNVCRKEIIRNCKVRRTEMSVETECHNEMQVRRTETYAKPFLYAVKSISSVDFVVVPVLWTCIPLKLTVLQTFRSSGPLSSQVYLIRVTSPYNLSFLTCPFTSYSTSI